MTLNLDQIKEIIAQSGHTDIAYLEHHFTRFKSTFDKVEETWPIEQGNRMLDIGAHWLHQSLLYAQAGYEVTAADFPLTLAEPSVIQLAKKHKINLLPYTDLEQAKVFNTLNDDQFDLILFTEIIEHITFNPVQFWKEIYRVLAPGGRLIITTPNYYSYKSRCWALKRFLSGYGGGLNTDSILNMRTYAHHWKEFSLKELSFYFYQLSQDFRIQRREHVSSFYTDTSNRLTTLLEHFLPFVRNDLYLEIQLDQKENGIAINPQW